MIDEPRPKPPGWIGNLIGAFTAAVVQIPVECAYGVIALAPLGPQFAAVGMLSALYSASVSNAVAGLAGSRQLACRLRCRGTTSGRCSPRCGQAISR